ncbi:MAG: right-handed parallel beta-helix repeat-containing protein [Chloroflexi bacterium]|nr:right-handed parallel beta-helix repeat-containing protein [Chloroflexota bacterium]
MPSVPVDYPGTNLPFTSTSTPSPTQISIVQAEAYSVSLFGDDANPGTQLQPWRTIQKAADTLPAGSIVIVQAGDYDERVMVSRAGSAGMPIVFQAQGTVIMRGFTVRANFVTIQGFEITNTLDNSIGGWGIFIEGSNCLLENNYIHYATRGGIQLYAPPDAKEVTANCVVRNNRLYYNSQLGIDVRGHNHLIEGNEIWGTIQHHPKMAIQPSWLDADGIHFHGSGHIFRGNYIHDILYTAQENIDPHIDCFQTFVNLSHQVAASNILFEQNRCENVQAQASRKYGSGFMINGASGLTIRNNIITADVGLNALNSSELKIIHNTFTSDLTLPTTYSPAGITFTSISNSTIQNNIFYNLPGHIIYLVNVTELSAGRNLAYRSDGNPLWTTNSYSHVLDLWGVDPLFVSATDFHLRVDSPAIDTGYVVAVTTDYDGRLRPQGQGVDIGAFEYSPPITNP